MPAKRRQNHEGTEWFDKARKVWRWRVVWQGEAHHVSDADRSRAKIKLRELLVNLQKNTHDKGCQTLREFLSYWLESAVRRDTGESTYHDYKKRCEIYITPTLGDYTLKDLDGNGKLIRAWSNACRDRYALSSARQAHAILKRALDVAVADGEIETNPARAVPPPRAAKATPIPDDDEDTGRALSDDAAQRALDEARRLDKWQSRSRAARSEGLWTFYLIAFRLGLRRGELLGLRWKDIDFERRIIRIRQQVVRRDRGKGTPAWYGISETLKTPAARRDLPLEDDIAAELRALKLRSGARTHVLGLVFPDADGQPRDPNSITRNFKRICERLGIDAHFHDVRATAISRWRRQGVDIEVTAALAGHEKADVTLDTYTDVGMDRKRLAFEK